MQTQKKQTRFLATTLKKFQELAGKQAVAEGHGWERSNGFVDAYRANVGASIHEVDRIDIKEINEQDKGEGHIFYRGKVIRSNMFFTGIKEDQVKDNFRYNQLLPIEYPDHLVLDGLVRLRRQVRYLERIADFDASTIDTSLIDEMGYWAEKGGPDWPTKILLRFNEPAPTSIKPEVRQAKAEISEVQATVDLLNEVDQVEEEDSGIDLSSLPGHVSGNPNDDLEEAIFAAPPEAVDDERPQDQRKSDPSLGEVLAGAKNSWVFTALAGASGNPRRCEDIVDALSGLNSSIGMNDIESTKAAVSSVKLLSEELHYPSQPVEARPDDADELFRAIEELSRGRE